MALTKVSSSLVSDSAVTSGKIADGGIATVDIADVAVTSAKIANNAILTQHIDDAQVTTDQLGADAVTAAKIADNAVSEEHLDITVITSLTAVTAATGDLLMVADVSDSNNLKKIPVSSILAGTHTGPVNTSGAINSGAAVTSTLYLNVKASGTSATALEIGTNTASNHNAHIDLVGDTTYSDFGLRIIRGSSGANTNSELVHRGTGALLITAQDAASIILRTNGSSALTLNSSQNATFAGTINSGAITSSGPITVNNVNDTYNFKAIAGDTDSWFGVYDDTNNSANIIVTRSDGATSFRHLGHSGATTISGTLSSGAITTSGNVSVGGSAYTTATDLNLLGDGISIKNDKAGSNNNWSLIQNTDTGSASNLSFTTGLGVALTLNHNKSATFGGTVTVDDVLNVTGTNRAIQMNGVTRINGVGDIIGTSYYVGASAVIDTNRNIAAGTIDSGVITTTGLVTSGVTNNFTHGTAWGTNLKLTNTNNDSSPPIITFLKAPAGGHTQVADNDYVGFINFRADNSNNDEFSWVELSAIANDITDGSEDSTFRIGTYGGGTEYGNTLVASSGKVGIGTADPSALLHLKSTTASVGPSLIFENTNNAQSMNIDYWDNAGAVQSRIQYSEGPAAWYFQPNVSTAASTLTIHYNGSVDVGGTPGGNVKTHGVVVSDAHKNSTLGTTLGDTQRVFGIHNKSQPRLPNI